MKEYVLVPTSSLEDKEHILLLEIVLIYRLRNKDLIIYTVQDLQPQNLASFVVLLQHSSECMKPNMLQ